MSPPRWLADEMVGRLARYLRFVGCDTVYARGWDDGRIVAEARRDGRVVVTRDRALAARSDRALLLTSPAIADQWRAVRRAYPEVPREPSFARCGECNGVLRPFLPGPETPRAVGIPWERVDRGLPLYRCLDCGHSYWEGTHSEHLRSRLSAWESEDVR